MRFISHLLPGAILLGTGMMVFGILEIIGSRAHKTKSTHSKEICEICGIVDDALIWHGVSIETLAEKCQLIYDPEGCVVLCNSCRNQSEESLAWQSLQKKET
jgi:hypothetical protein